MGYYYRHATGHRGFIDIDTPPPPIFRVKFELYVILRVYRGSITELYH